MKTDRLAYYNHACTIFFAIWCMVNYMPSDLRSWAAARPILDMGRPFYQPEVGLIKISSWSIDPDESTDIGNTISRCRNRPSRPTTHIDRSSIGNTHLSIDQDDRPGRIDPSYRPKPVSIE